MAETTIRTVGIDIGDRKSHYCILTSAGAIEERGVVSTDWDEVHRFFGKLGGRCRVVMEVGTHSPWMFRAAVAAGHETLVANARKLKLLTQNDRKRDRKDAELLARIARASPDLLSLVHHRGEQAQKDLQLLRSRDLLVRKRTSCILEVRSLVKSVGRRLPKSTAESFADAARAAIPEELAPALEPVLLVIDALTKQIASLEQRLEALAKGRYKDDVELVAQPVGVGLITALAFVLTLEDKKRFKKSRDVAPYLGLVPRSDQSGAIDKQLGISKAGDPFVRRLLVQCASYILQPRTPETDLRTWARKLAERGGRNGKKRATIALARKLAVLMHRLWVTGEVYTPQGYGRAA